MLHLQGIVHLELPILVSSLIYYIKAKVRSNNEKQIIQASNANLQS